MYAASCAIAPRLEAAVGLCVLEGNTSGVTIHKKINTFCYIIKNISK